MSNCAGNGTQIIPALQDDGRQKPRLQHIEVAYGIVPPSGFRVLDPVLRPGKEGHKGPWCPSPGSILGDFAIRCLTKPEYGIQYPAT
eukprot:1082663-Amphidinium_carterae.1